MNQLKGVVDRLEGEFYVIKLGGEQEIYWPKSQSGFIFTDGDVVNLTLSLEEADTIKREGEAKDILRQIFQTNA